MFNESEGVELLHKRLSEVVRGWNEPCEIIFVDDGSRDDTLNLCLNIRSRDDSVKVLSFTRNFGHQAAVTAGLCYASGDIVAVMDADLQDPPEELYRFIEKCREGHDVVYAVRTKRKEGPVKKLSYWLYYRILSALTTLSIPLDAGDFCVMNAQVLRCLNDLPERNRFIRGLRAWVGYRQTGLPYERNERQFGKPKYTLAKLFNLAMDGLINFSYRPLRLAMFAGILVGGVAFLGGIIVFGLYLMNTGLFGYYPHNTQGWTSLMLAIVFLAGTQLVCIGILGEYVGKVFEESKGRPPYLVARQVGFDHDERLYPGGINVRPSTMPQNATKVLNGRIFESH
jgi:dolichol-phosphate mannosyltransferase